MLIDPALPEQPRQSPPCLLADHCQRNVRRIEHGDRCRYRGVVLGIDEFHNAADVVREVRREAADQYVGILLAIVEYADAYRAVDARQHWARVRREETRCEIRTDDLHRNPFILRAQFIHRAEA